MSRGEATTKDRKGPERRGAAQRRGVGKSLRRRSRRRRTLQNELLFLAFALLRFLTRILPERYGDWLGRQLGLLTFRIQPYRRAVAVTNIRAALGLTEPEAERLARESAAHLGLLGVEFIRFAGRADLIKQRVRMTGEDHLRQALAAGRGAILLFAHLGNWELGGQAVGIAGYRVHPIVQPQANARFFAVVERYREKAGLQPITRGFTLREMLRALGRGDCVLIMPDQDAGRKGIFVPFFGRPASTPRGIAVLARLAKAPVVPFFIRRLRPGFHEVRFHPPLDLVRTDDEDADTRENLTRVNRLLERVIAEYPEQWFWMHKRWKTKPRGGIH